MKGTTIVLHSSQNPENPRAVTKILTMKDGFAVVTPYHCANSCFLMKSPVDYSKEEMTIPFENCVTYEATSRAKLSIHFGGFAQFSGEDSRKIISGKDSTTGEPRGLGIENGGPFDIRSDPVALVGIWGLEDFKEAKSSGPVINLYESQSITRQYNSPCMQEFMIEIWMIPENFRRLIFDYLGKRMIRLELPQFSQLAFPQNLLVVPLPGLSHFLGLQLIRCRGTKTLPDSSDGLAEYPKSGFTLSGPSVEDKNGQFWGLQGFYPRPEIFSVTQSHDRPIQE